MLQNQALLANAHMVSTIIRVSNNSSILFLVMGVHTLFQSSHFGTGREDAGKGCGV